MKHFILLLLAISITGGCKNAENTNEYNALIPNISDLAMTEELQKIFSDRIYTVGFCTRTFSS